MATPMTVEQLLAGLRKWQIKYAAYKDWTKHNRNHMGPWGPVNGLMIHHTGSDNTDQRELLYSGYRELPGPLCHWGLAQDGTLWLIGHGRANHAGLGDDDVLTAVINETDAPVDNESNTDGNRHFYGVEIWYSGNHGMTDDQYFTLMKLAAMVCDFHDWNELSCIGHGEWQPGKWDPGYKPGVMMNMDNVRSDIKAAIQRGPNPVATAPKKTAGYSEIWDQDVAKPPVGRATTANPYWTPMSILCHAAEQAEQARKNTEKIMKKLGIE